MTPPIRGISSMATRQVLAELAAAYADATGQPVDIESVGGVDAERRIAAGEAFDLVVLASAAIGRLAAAGSVLPASRVDLVRSETVAAVRRGAPQPDISSEVALRRAVHEARSIGYSTGPSGVALAALFERWGMADECRAKLVVPPPGVAVGTLVASGEVALGFQQLAELIHVDGIELLGPLPAAVAIVTIFSGAVAEAGRRPREVEALLAYMAAPEAAAIKRKYGMAPVIAAPARSGELN